MNSEPRSLIDKLGVKAHSRVAVLGVDDQGFWEQLRERTTDVSEGEQGKQSDVIFLLVEHKEALAGLRRLEEGIKPNGALWVVFPKGKQHIRETDVIAAGKAAGLVDNKVVRFSETHTALRLVIPLARRKPPICVDDGSGEDAT